MEDIKVGEKIRCNDGLVGELIRIERDDIDTSLKWYVFDDGKNERYVNKPYITKHSFNIIDLLEVGDIVVILDTKFNSKDYVFIDDTEMLQAVRNDTKDRCKLLEILTHQQFEANCYKVKEQTND